jgi:hypothetical protein
MGIFSQREYPEGHPNAKRYELRYDDGERYVFRHPGREPQRDFTLESAVMWANQAASDGHQLSVIDPETGAVLWTGEGR